jgi:hypothetical protein
MDAEDFQITRFGLEGGAALIRDKTDPPAAGQQGLGQRTGWKYVATGTTGGDQGERCAGSGRHGRSPEAPVRRLVSASAMPIAIPNAIRDEPP